MIAAKRRSQGPVIGNERYNQSYSMINTGPGNMYTLTPVQKKANTLNAKRQVPWKGEQRI